MKTFDTKKLEQILKSRFFISQTAQIYGGVAGLYDMGPILFGMKQNFFLEWRKHFVYHDQLLEIDTSILLPYSVLKASGHVEKFCDILICDEINGLSYRADHYIEKFLSNLKKTEEITEIMKSLDCMSCKEINDVISKYNIRTPDNNKFTDALKFNLMFETNLGYKKDQSFFLRPETAQGQFLNFKKMYEFNNKRMPFGSATIGRAFRNEISPRSGLIRTREFEQAEIEFFVSPTEKNHQKFSVIKDLNIPLCFNDKEVTMILDKAVDQRIINNETLGYFIGRTYLFLLNIGIDPTLLRFRQHKKDEMAHYAKDCWDCEIFSSYGWIECVGIADRSVYDLNCHSKASGVDLSFSDQCISPIYFKKWKPIIEKSKWIKILRNDYESFKSEVESLSSDFIDKEKIEENGTFYINFNDHKVECKFVTEVIYEKKCVPDVIEPSFGIGRILYVLLEHSFYSRDCGRSVLRLKPKISFTKCVISYVQYDPLYKPFLEDLTSKLYSRNIMVNVNDRSCSIGKKYVSCDEIGIPFFITFDMDSLIDNMVTIRERDSMEQVRVKLSQVVCFIEELVNERITWEELKFNSCKI